MTKIKEASRIIGVSEATIRNWIKTGILEPENSLNIDELLKLKDDIENGRINRLKKRANKSTLNNKFIPEEYIEKNKFYDENINRIKNIAYYINKKELEIEKSINYLLFNYIKSFNLLEKENILKEIGNIDITDKKYSTLIDFKLPETIDPVGLIYQSIFKEGDKSKKGSYYTPLSIIEEIKSEYINSDIKICDPCCGTGQFLLSFSDIIKNPFNLYGFDIDKIAIRICRINLLLKYKDMDFNPNVFCLNTLTEKRDIKDFDLIATNPPWGAHFKEDELNILKERYPHIKSKESFSYFIIKSLEILKDGGILSFILPESILNVSIHKDVREIISKYNIKNIKHYGKIFKNVFSNVIRIDIIKDNNNNNNNNENILINIKDKDREIFNKIFNLSHTTLKKKAKWALGIVTGNNSKYLVKEKITGFEPIYTGKEVKPFFLDNPNYYIKWTPSIFQQVAKEEYYRNSEKLVYRFISKNLIFAYDNSKSLTLNSANILIPDLDYSIKVILALFNSSLYQFIFRKIFNSIKVLRSHLESLPLPFFSENIIKDIESMVDYIIKNRSNNFSELDDYIFSHFNLEKYKEYIKKIAKE